MVITLFLSSCDLPEEDEKRHTKDPNADLSRDTAALRYKKRNAKTARRPTGERTHKKNCQIIASRDRKLDRLMIKVCTSGHDPGSDPNVIVTPCVYTFCLRIAFMKNGGVYGSLSAIRGVDPQLSGPEDVAGEIGNVVKSRCLYCHI